MYVTDTDGFELTATDIQLDNPIEPGSIIAIKRPIKVSLVNTVLYNACAIDFTVADYNGCNDMQ